MKVFISADIEGVAGTIYKVDELPGGMFYDRNCDEMSKEVAACCRAAIECGATEIVVKDAHGTGANLIPSYFQKEVTLIRGWEKHPYEMVQGIDSSFDCVAFVGYHGAAGDIGNPRSHTMSSATIQKATLNGVPMSEYYLHSLIASSLGVPSVFLAGDKSLCRSAEKLTPGLITAPVKEGFGNSNLCLGQEEAEELIYERAKKAFSQDVKQIEPTAIPEKLHVEIVYKEHTKASQTQYFPGCYRVDAFTVAFDPVTVYELAQTMLFIV